MLEQLRAGLAGRYEVSREIGSGGMAIVFLARDLKHQRTVAIKVLRAELGGAVAAAASCARSRSPQNFRIRTSCGCTTREKRTA